MRLRNIPGAREEMLVNPYVIQNPRQYSGQFARCLFHNDNPLHIEIGTGKGQFLTGLARRSPDINYIGIDRYSSVLIKAVARQEQLELPNLRFLCEDAMSLPEIFGPGEVSRIYLNFPDPWPKDRHARRRLTSPEFLARYRLFLAEDGAIEFKTDNIPLFDYSIGSASGSGWRITRLTRDLPHSADDAHNIRTEYEERFAAAGTPICRMFLNAQGKHAAGKTGTPLPQAMPEDGAAAKPQDVSPEDTAIQPQAMPADGAAAERPVFDRSGADTDYDLLLAQLEALADEESYFIPLLSNASALLYETLPCLNWAGFYLMKDGALVLGPFQGKTACIHITVGKGVCGTAAASGMAQLVPDVHAFPGHIACDSASNSEIVVPIRIGDELFGVLDIDSPYLNRFSESDRDGLERFAALLGRRITT